MIEMCLRNSALPSKERRVREQNYQYALTQGGTTLTKTTSKLSLSHKTMFFF